MTKRALLEIEAYLAELDADELLMLRASVSDLLLVYGTGDAKGDEPCARANDTEPSTGDDELSADAKRGAGESTEALAAAQARKRRALH